MAVCVLITIGQSGSASAQSDFMKLFQTSRSDDFDNALKREMSSVEISHWIALVAGVHLRLDAQKANGTIEEEELFRQKERLNELVVMSLKYYNTFPEDLAYDIHLLTNRIDRVLVQLKEPKYAAVIEVPLSSGENAKSPKRILKDTSRPFQFIWPVASVNVTSAFGYRIHPFTGKSSFHEGIDLSGEKGTLIYAAERGFVEFAGRLPRAGKTVILRHKNGFRTIYAHLQSFLTVKGLFVERGQPIGLMGRTGRVTGVHLHFEINQGNKPLNPQKWVGQILGTVQQKH